MRRSSVNKTFKFLSVLTLSVAIISMAGCQKKVTKVEEEPPPPPPPVEEEEPPPPPPPPPPPAIDSAAEVRNALETIYFDYDKSELRPEAISALEGAASVMSEYPTVRVMAEGHADERGGAEYNMGLGEDRANAAKEYLSSYGIEVERLETTSYGKERPVNPNCDGDDECHSLNRRVEWRVLD